MKMTIGPNDTQYLDDMKFVKYECFCDNAEIESVVIEKGVEGVGTRAFDECVNLSHVELPPGLKEVTGFSNCSKLTRIELPEGVETIGSDAFYGCTNLVEVRLPSTLKSIRPGAFGGCANLEKINLPRDPETYSGGARRIRDSVNLDRCGQDVVRELPRQNSGPGPDRQEQA